MPTGYTSELYEGKKITFQKFAMNCARAFGALVMMRDDDRDAKIPDEFKPSDHSLQRKKQAERGLKAVSAWSAEDAKREAQASYDKAMVEYKTTKTSHLALATRYQAMLAEVKKWNPPTQDHQGLKKFMIEQLETSLEDDCYEPDMPKLEHWLQFRAREIADAKHDIAYYAKSYADEVKRAEKRTGWVRDLRESLGVVKSK